MAARGGKGGAFSAQKKLGDRALQLSGFDEYARMASDLAPKQARNLARATVQGIASEARKMMRKNAPKGDGTLRKAIKSKKRSMRGDVAVSDVRIEHGNQAQHDAWYWHFIEFGTQKRANQKFIRPANATLEEQLPRIWSEQFAKRLTKQLEKMHKAQGVKT